MALSDTLDRLPPWALYGGAGVVAGGGYLLYRRRKAEAGGSSDGSTTGTPSSLSSAPVSAFDSQYQQPSIVPYYLTADSSTGSSGVTTTRKSPPLPKRAKVPGGSGATGTTSSGTAIPDIPPILPSSPAPATSAPVPAAQNNNLPADLLAKIQAGGEQIIGSLASPAGGVWYLGSKGGVFAINAPFFGSAAGQPYFTGRQAIQIVPNGSGYTIVDATGSRYNYGG